MCIRDSRQISQGIFGFSDEGSQRFLNIGIMALIVSEQQAVILVQNCDFYCSGTNIDVYKRQHHDMAGHAH